MCQALGGLATAIILAAIAVSDKAWAQPQDSGIHYQVAGETFSSASLFTDAITRVGIGYLRITYRNYRSILLLRPSTLLRTAARPGYTMGPGRDLGRGDALPYQCGIVSPAVCIRSDEICPNL